MVRKTLEQKLKLIEEEVRKPKSKFIAVDRG